MTTMLDFYRQHAISPVTQDVSDLQAHFERRAFLYRSLGLWPESIRGKSVLEVGPGSGENALYTASLFPSEYALVEPNPTAAALTTGVLSRRAGRFGFVNWSVIKNTLDRCDLEEFDVVLCEGLLGLCGSDPRILLSDLVRHVKVGGVLVITCIDAISDCAEVLRRAMAHRILDRTKSLQEQVQQLVPVFTPHLATLKGMTRSVEDWILDNILSPASIGPTFSIPDALSALEGHFAVQGCSPSGLIPNWDWYKRPPTGNQWAIDAYWRNCHNLFDYRKVEPEKEEVQNQQLMRLCKDYRRKVQAYECGDRENWPVPLVPKEGDVSSWFGRGQQYLSMVRVA